MNKQFDLNPDTEDQARLKGFAKEYSQLCDKYNLFINSCGCCSSPFLSEKNCTKLSEYLAEVNYVEPDTIERQVETLIRHNPGKF